MPYFTSFNHFQCLILQEIAIRQCLILHDLLVSIWANIFFYSDMLAYKSINRGSSHSFVPFGVSAIRRSAIIFISFTFRPSNFGEFTELLS